MGADLLTKYLKAHGLRPAGLARAAGISRATLSNIMNERRACGWTVARALEKATKGAVPAEAWLKKKPRKSKAASAGKAA